MLFQNNLVKVKCQRSAVPGILSPVSAGSVSTQRISLIVAIFFVEGFLFLKFGIKKQVGVHVSCALVLGNFSYAWKVVRVKYQQSFVQT